MYEVGNPEIGFETWREGTVLIHNPYAIHKLPPEWFGAAVEERMESGQVVSTFQEDFVPYNSITLNFDSTCPEEMIYKEATRINVILRSMFGESSQ